MGLAGPPAEAAGTPPSELRAPAGRMLGLLEQAVPPTGSGFTPATAARVAAASAEFEQWFERYATSADPRDSRRLVDRATRLVAIKGRVDRMLDRTLAAGRSFARQTAGPERRSALRSYLQTASDLIDLSGRLRYVLYDALYEVAFAVAGRPRDRDRLVEVLIHEQSSIGAAVMADALFDPPPDSANHAQRASPRTKARLLELIAVTGQIDLVPTLAELLAEPQLAPSLVIRTIEVLGRIGLPQDPRPGQAADLPKPPLTATELRRILERLPPAALGGDLGGRRRDLIEWLNRRIAKGIVADQYVMGRFAVRAGDWLLMRNPSPYNLFTDLSPGLFTHVGVITTEVGSDGKRRMVVVDLPEQGTTMQVTNVDLFVQRTLHYVVLRHEDAGVAKTMGLRARSTIGVATRFDLNFRTDRVLALQGQELAGRKIDTYCAGLLLLCAQETGRDRREFFPIAEHPAGGKTVANLARLGLSFGEQFVSPTGALFSPHFTIVGRRDPMYEPSRQIEETIYDHFAHQLEDRDLIPAPDLGQRLRLRLAEAARTNRLLARTLANAAGVDADTDLVSAAKTMAVVETLDEIARSNSRRFAEAIGAFWAGPLDELVRQGTPKEKLQQVQAYRKRHADLFQDWISNRLTPRQLRIRLVDYYCAQGKRQLDERFFRTSGR